MKGEVISQVGTATIKIAFALHRDHESNPVCGDGAEGMFQGTQRTNSTAVVKNAGILVCLVFSPHRNSILSSTSRIFSSVFQKYLQYTKGLHDVIQVKAEWLKFLAQTSRASFPFPKAI